MVVSTRRRREESQDSTMEEQRNSYASDSTMEEQRNSYASSFLKHGGEYNSYQEMVEAKRRRNMEMLQSTGLLGVATNMKSRATKRGIKSITGKSEDKSAKAIRKSSRLAGEKALDIFLNGRMNVEVGGNDSDNRVGKKESHFYKGRVNDGSDLSVKKAVEMSDTKWVGEDSVESAIQFTKLVNSLPKATRIKSESQDSVHVESVSDSKPESVTSLSSQIHNLDLDVETNEEGEELFSPTAKLTPGRIYSIVCHPSKDQLITCAGDKYGYIGIWHVNDSDTNTNSNKTSDGVHLFKPHSKPVSHLEWNKSGKTLFSMSYDSTVREFDVAKEVFKEVFATYDDSEAFSGNLGYGLQNKPSFWIQHGCLDSRNNNCIYLATSTGDILHIDLRGKSVETSSKGGYITFNRKYSEKKINTVSVHPNGYNIATGGLDNSVKLWDVRYMGAKTRALKPIAAHHFNRSVNSAFFSPSGKNLLSTIMSNHLHLISDPCAKTKDTKPITQIPHNNQTGRWLSTFMANWHPTTREELFVVGCMTRPRAMEVFNGDTGELLRAISGDGLTAVPSRCCFHPSEDNLIICGGNASGRVSIAQARNTK